MSENPETSQTALTSKIVVTGGKRNARTVLHETRWLRLCQLDYTDQYGTERKWDMVERANVTTDVDCVDVIPILKRKGSEDQIILELQYRPPMDALSLEFPSGLVDPGETADVAALRELREETGYTGVVRQVTPSVSLEPGLASEVSKLVIVDIDGDLEENQNPKQHLEGSECIELIFVPFSQLFDTITDLIKTRKCIVDAKLYTFALAQKLNFQRIVHDLKDIIAQINSLVVVRFQQSFRILRLSFRSPLSVPERRHDLNQVESNTGTAAANIDNGTAEIKLVR